jgi:hypothetical protein
MQFLITDEDVTVAKFKDAIKRRDCLNHLRKQYPSRNLKPLDFPDPPQQQLLFDETQTPKKEDGNGQK